MRMSASQEPGNIANMARDLICIDVPDFSVILQAALMRRFDAIMLERAGEFKILVAVWALLPLSLHARTCFRRHYAPSGERPVNVEQARTCITVARFAAP